MWVCSSCDCSVLEDMKSQVVNLKTSKDYILSGPIMHEQPCLGFLCFGISPALTPAPAAPIENCLESVFVSRQPGNTTHEDSGLSPDSFGDGRRST